MAGTFQISHGGYGKVGHDDEDLDHYEAHANVQDRKCTDIPCCLVFIVAMVGMLMLLFHGLEFGDTRRISHGINYNDQVCGVDTAVADKPYLYYCLAPSSTTVLSLEFPICVDQCYSTANMSISCPSFNPGPVTVPMYPSKLYAGKICLPDSPLLKQQITGNGTVLSAYQKVSNGVDSIQRGWFLIVISFLASVLGGFLFMFLLRECGRPIVYLSLLVVLVGSIGFGSYFVYRSWDALEEPAAAHDSEAFANSRQMQLYLGIGLLGFGLIFFAATCCCCRQAIEVAIAVIEESCNVVFEMPSLLMQPLAEVIIKGIATILLLYGLILLVTCGTSVPKTITVGTYQLKGIYREFEWTDKQKAMMLYWIFGTFWIQELIVAFGLFCIAYSTVLWFFTPKDPQTHHKDVPATAFPLCQGFRYALQYHLGSLALGSFIIALCRFVQLILGYLAKQAKEEHNKIMEALAKCLMCVIECFKRTMEFLNKNAYIDIAINSTNFCSAAWHAFTAIVTNGGKYAYLNGACEVIKYLGLFLITLAGIAVGFFGSTFGSYDDPASDHFLQAPYAVVAVCGLIAFSVAISFMHVYDMISDTLLFCFIDSSSKGSVQAYCPDSMMVLMNDDHGKGCC